jgi:protein involved in polysaccharide export with SLBB domain
MKLKAIVLCVCLAVSSPLAAEEYRLIAGDRINLTYNLLPEAKTVMIDIDGNIRLADLGTIIAKGKTLTEIEKDVVESMIRNGYSGTPFVTAEIVEYAPIIVSGYVGRSGVYPYVPGTTAGVAIAIAGSAGATNPIIANADLQALAAKRRAASLATQIVSTVAQIAGLEASLAGPDTPVAVSAELKAVVPEQELSHLEALIASENGLLEAQRTATKDQLASFEKEISDYAAQINNLDARIALQNEMIDQLTADTTSARSLQSQGLATNSQTTTLILRLADERADLLALETAKLNTQRSSSLAERNRQQFLAEQNRSRLQQLNDARDKLHQLRGEQAYAFNEVSLTNANIGAVSPTEEGVTLEITLAGPRANRVDPASVDENTPLLPGDILLVKSIPNSP